MYPDNLTNNNFEAINHVIKLTTNWKPQKLPDLILKLQQISELHIDVRRCLHGQGNYTLKPEYRKYEVPKVIWDTKTKDEQNELFLKFLNVKMASKAKTIKSNDGQLSIPVVPQLAKKPGQKQTAKSERTTSKRRKMIA